MILELIPSRSETYHVFLKTIACYSSLGHSSISSPVVQSTDSRQAFIPTVNSQASTALCGAEVEGALTSVRVSTGQRTTVLSNLQMLLSFCGPTSFTTSV